MTEACFDLTYREVRSFPKLRTSLTNKKQNAPMPTLRQIVSQNQSVHEQIDVICSKHHLPADRFIVALLELIDRHPERRNIPRVDPSKLPLVAPIKYSDRKSMPNGKKENIVEFLASTWLPWIESGVLTRVTLRNLDPSADKAIDNWLSNGNTIPNHLRLLTKKELIDKIITDDPSRVLSDKRLRKVILSRQSRQVQAPGMPI